MFPACLRLRNIKRKLSKRRKCLVLSFSRDYVEQERATDKFYLKVLRVYHYALDRIPPASNSIMINTSE